MRSHLTRRVFRCLLANEPLFPRRHLHIRPARRPSVAHQNALPRLHHIPQRTFFNIFNNKQSRDLREPMLDPGMEKMLELDKRIHLVARLPPPEELVEAFNAFVQNRFDKGRPIEDFHAIHLRRTLKTLQHPTDRTTATETDPASSLHKLKLDIALRAMNLHTLEFTKIHSKLARDIFEAIQNLKLPSEDKDISQKRLMNFVALLCKTGDADEALELWLEHRSVEGTKQQPTWTRLVYGFATEGKEEAMLRTAELARENGIDLALSISRVVALYYAQRDNVEETKKWVEKSQPWMFSSKNVVDPSQNPQEVYRIILEFCLRNDEMEWGQSMLENGAKRTSEQHTWDAILRAAAATGKSVDEVDRMISVMVRDAKNDGKDAGPGIKTFNSLIQFALSRNDAYTAERYFALAQKWGAEPNAQSFILQIEYRLAAGDVGGALSAYNRLRDEKIADNEDWDIMNRLVRVVLARPKIPSETIIGLVEDISDRRKIFPADTVLALCTYHLNRDEYFELVDLLQTYAYQYSIAQRMRMRDRLVSYTLDPKTDTGRAWDTYMIFHQIFDTETKRNIRNSVITAFFDRGRPDLAAHVFTKMNRHVRADTRPNEDTYVRMFEGIAKTADSEALEVVHNLLKLDTETEPTTRVLNGLMLAYTGCDRPGRALEFWEQIATSDEGPSYNSLHIAFRACEKAPWGYRTAKTIWEKLLVSDIVIERDLFVSYVSSLSGQSLFDDMVQEIGKMEEIVGHSPDTFTLGSIYNAAIGINWQARIEQWAKKAWPKVWEELDAAGFEEEETGLKRFNSIDRTVRA